jgi:hypothetical protein
MQQEADVLMARQLAPDDRLWQRMNLSKRKRLRMTGVMGKSTCLGTSKLTGPPVNSVAFGSSLQCGR